MADIVRNFNVNRTASAFLKDTTSQVKLLFGCVGSGKSSACMVEIYMMACRQPKGHDGIRRSRWAIIRSTYSQLKTTTIKTWQEWFPEAAFGPVKGDSPMTHFLKFNEVECEIIFLAIEGLSDIQRLKSLELTGAYINEAQFFHSSEIITQVLERTSRYPGKIYGGALGRHLVIMDCNPPSITHWIYRIFEKERPDHWAIYRMPPAVIKDESGNYINNPNADFVKQQENPRYWIDMVRGASEEYIRVSLCGEYGVVEEGRPIHPEYNDQLHYSPRPLAVNDQMEIGLGWDFGNTPACAVVQMMPDGQLIVLHEFWTEYMSVRAFAEDIVIPQLDRHYPWWRNNYISRHDPAGQSMNADGGTCQSILMELGIISSPAESNAPQFRRDGLKYFLSKLLGGKPSILLSHNISMIREGLMGKFKYELIKSSALSDVKQYQEKPLKNLHSHSCEGLEYICTHYANNTKYGNEPKHSSIVVEMANKINRISKAKEQSWRR